MEVHIVQKGDTLWKISRQFGVSFDELKRVNAHLANPDYIVPGMKIFLPAKLKGKTETKPSEAVKVTKTEKAPPPVVEKVQVAPEQLRPVPQTPAVPGLGEVPEMPEMPMVQEMPQIPIAQELPQMPEPMKQPPPPPLPIAPPMQQFTPPPMEMQPVPMYGVPCGWMPIFDADCFPFMYPGHMHHQGPINAPPPNMQPNMAPESPVYTNEMPMQLPVIPMPEDWRLVESPMIQFEEDIKFKKMPNVHFEESLSIPFEEELAAEEVAEEAVQKMEKEFEKEYEMEFDRLSPIGMNEQYESPLQGGMEYGQYMGHPTYQAYPQGNYGCGMPDCGCGMPYPQVGPCGCGHWSPMIAPVQASNYCNACSQPIQAMPMPMPMPMPNQMMPMQMPNQMMPYPAPNNNWYGTY